MIQRFRGDLTLLDSRGGGGDAAVGDRGGDFGRSTPIESGGGGERTGSGSYAEELDDEIPF